MPRLEVERPDLSFHEHDSGKAGNYLPLDGGNLTGIFALDGYNHLVACQFLGERLLHGNCKG